MKTKLCVVWLLTFAFVCFRQADAATLIVPSSTKPMTAATAAQSKMFRALYAKADAAALRGNVAFFSTLYTDQYMLFYKSGAILEKPQYVALLKEVMKHVIKFNAVQTQIKLIQQAERNVFFVTATSRLDMTYRGLDKKIHRSLSISQTMDSWLLTKRGWRMQNSQELETHSLVDGRKV